MTKVNPYDPPTPIADAAIVDPRTAARIELGRPATAIIILASIHSVLDSIPIVSYLIMTLQGGRIYSGSTVLTEAILLFALHVFQAICGAKMGHLQSLRLAYAGAILVTIPLLSPLIVLGIPFGIWALILLGKPTNRAAFAKAVEP